MFASAPKAGAKLTCCGLWTQKRRYRSEGFEFQDVHARARTQAEYFYNLKSDSGLWGDSVRLRDDPDLPWNAAYLSNEWQFFEALVRWGWRD